MAESPNSDGAGGAAAAPYVGFARKWRPQTFEDLVGQPQISQALRQGIEKKRISHAYLFAGPRGVGKTSTARILAKAINCEHGPTPTPCGVCENCRSIVAGSNLDVIEIDGASNNGVEQVRELRDSVNHVPFSCRYKIYIIDEVHMLSIAAFNALLKTLEEPPEFVVFIFATTEMEKIPDTIRSRCQALAFRSITIEDIVSRLEYIARREGVEIEESERQAILETIALSADGGMRDAQVALDQVVSLADGALRLEAVRDFLGLADRASLARVVEGIRDGDTPALLEIVRALSERGRDLERFIKQLLGYLRDVTILACGAPDDLTRLTGSGLDEAKRFARELDPAMLVNAIGVLLDLEPRLRQGGQPRLLLEFAFVRLTAFDSLRPISELIARLDGAPPSSPEPGGGTARAPAPRETPTSHEAPAPRETPAPREAGAIPLRGGGALEPVSRNDIEALRQGLLQAIDRGKSSLASTLAHAPLERIEGNTAYFGRPDRPLARMDTMQFEKPENLAALREALCRLTGARDMAVRLLGEAGGGAPGVSPRAGRRPEPAARPLAAAPETRSSAPPPIAERSALEADSLAEAGYDDPPPYEDESEYSVNAEEARRLFGLKGMSAAGIKKLLESNAPFREKIEMAVKALDGVVLDGDGNPVS